MKSDIRIYLFLLKIQFNFKEFVTGKVLFYITSSKNSISDPRSNARSKHQLHRSRYIQVHDREVNQ